MLDPRVSVITPVYNRRTELPRALQSLEGQTNLNLEHIILDDALRVYHTESDNSITRSGLKEQTLINCLYNSLWYINNGKKYNIPKKVIVFNALVYATFKHLLRWKFSCPRYDWARKGVQTFWGKLFQILIWVPSLFAAALYCHIKKL